MNSSKPEIFSRMIITEVNGRFRMEAPMPGKLKAGSAHYHVHYTSGDTGPEQGVLNDRIHKYNESHSRRGKDKLISKDDFEQFKKENVDFRFELMNP